MNHEELILAFQSQRKNLSSKRNTDIWQENKAMNLYQQNVIVIPLPNPWSWKSSLTSPFFDTLKKRFDKLQLLAQPWCKIFGKRQPTNDNKYSSFIVIENSIFGSSIIYINVRTSSFETRVLSCLIIDNCHLILLQKTLINN